MKELTFGEKNAAKSQFRELIKADKQQPKPADEM